MGTRVKTLNRKIRLEKLAEEGKAYCTRHEEYITKQRIGRRHCYSGNHGKSICQYFREQISVENIQIV